MTSLNLSLTHSQERENNTGLTGLLCALNEMIMESETIKDDALAWLSPDYMVPADISPFHDSTLKEKHLLSSC